MRGETVPPRLRTFGRGPRGLPPVEPTDPPPLGITVSGGRHWCNVVGVKSRGAAGYIIVVREPDSAGKCGQQTQPEFKSFTRNVNGIIPPTLRISSPISPIRPSEVLQFACAAHNCSRIERRSGSPSGPLLGSFGAFAPQRVRPFRDSFGLRATLTPTENGDRSSPPTTPDRSWLVARTKRPAVFWPDTETRYRCRIYEKTIIRIYMAGQGSCRA